MYPVCMVITTKYFNSINNYLAVKKKILIEVFEFALLHLYSTDGSPMITSSMLLNMVNANNSANQMLHFWQMCKVSPVLDSKWLAVESLHFLFPNRYRFLLAFHSLQVNHHSVTFYTSYLTDYLN